MKPRIKTHSFPGDVSKQEKEAMLEGRHPDRKRAKTFKEIAHMSERAVLKEQAKAEIQRNDESMQQIRREVDATERSDNRAELLRKAYRECKGCYIHGRVAGRAMTPYECALCHETDVHTNTATPRICEPCSKKHNVCRRCGEKLETTA